MIVLRHTSGLPHDEDQLADVRVGFHDAMRGGGITKRVCREDDRRHDATTADVAAEPRATVACT
jgi:hypothetical protein